MDIQYLSDPENGKNKSAVCIAVKSGKTLIDARIALNTVGPIQFQRRQASSNGLMTVVYQAVTIPWLSVCYSPPSGDPDHDTKEIQRILGPNCVLR